MRVRHGAPDESTSPALRTTIDAVASMDARRTQALRAVEACRLQAQRPASHRYIVALADCIATHRRRASLSAFGRRGSPSGIAY